jgi:hypothetical protein
MTRMEDEIIRVLKMKGELTTSEVEDTFRADGTDCPDGAAKTLMKLKTQGRIVGRIDREKRGWVWSVV